MGFAETVLLGAIAGFDDLSRPALRAHRAVDDRVRVALAMFSVGILAFIFMDVTSHGREIVATALARFKHHHASFGHVLGRSRCSPPASRSAPRGSRRRSAACAAARRCAALIAGGATDGVALAAPDAVEARRRALQTGMTIAGAIGLHNFAEGLAIGVSARAGAIGLATVLIVGFGAHNATEGFGSSGRSG